MDEFSPSVPPVVQLRRPRPAIGTGPFWRGWAHECCRAGAPSPESLEWIRNPGADSKLAFDAVPGSEMAVEQLAVWRRAPTMTSADAQRASKRAGSTVVEVKGSHAVYVSKPGSVADIIEAAAAA